MDAEAVQEAVAAIRAATVTILDEAHAHTAAIRDLVGESSLVERNVRAVARQILLDCDAMMLAAMLEPEQDR